MLMGEVCGEQECIPHQLQTLFARLAQSSRGAVPTKELTTSFCWTNADSFKVSQSISQSVTACCTTFARRISNLISLALSYQQHDVQELMRVLFTALEGPLRDVGSTGSLPSHPSGSTTSPTSSSGGDGSEERPSFLNALYQGTYLDGVTCTECGNRSARKDTFLDVSIDVADCSTIEESMGNFIKVETLSGERSR